MRRKKKNIMKRTLKEERNLGGFQIQIVNTNVVILGENSSQTLAILGVLQIIH